MKILLKGNLVSDPEIRFTASGEKWATFTVAENHYKKLDNGTYEDLPTTFWNCAIWGNGVDGVEKLVKGTSVLAVGRNRTSNYEDKDGNKRSSLQVVVEEIGVNVKSKSFFALVSDSAPAPADSSPF